MKIEFESFSKAIDLGNLGVIAPHKVKYYNRYNIDWLIETVKAGTQLKYVTFWHEGKEYPNHYFSQWYQGKPFSVNGRSYLSAEQYMMSEKAQKHLDVRLIFLYRALKTQGLTSAFFRFRKDAVRVVRQN